MVCFVCCPGPLSFTVVHHALLPTAKVDDLPHGFPDPLVVADVDSVGRTGHFKNSRHGDKLPLDSPDRAAKRANRNGSQPGRRGSSFKRVKVN